MQKKRDHISICICTYKRPLFLKRLLNKLQFQRVNGFSYSIVVVDNDNNLSGKPVFSEVEKKYKENIVYISEPERSISLARNAAVRNAKGKYIAFIDDDEFPDPDWLLNLYTTIEKYNIDGVLGPVLPHFENDPPPWIVRSKILERKSFKTGEVIPIFKYTRTGNVLLKRNLFKNEEDYFDKKYGLTGGGDAVFFKRMMAKGKTFVWNNEAIVYETIPLERQKRLYYVKRAFTRGMGDAQASPSFFNFDTVKSVIAFLLYTPLLPFLLLMSHNHFMRYLIKDCDHAGKLLAYCGIRPVKERPY
jgi:succinoglycan biosynthesis protein ExoM